MIIMKIKKKLSNNINMNETKLIPLNESKTFKKTQKPKKNSDLKIANNTNIVTESNIIGMKRKYEDLPQVKKTKKKIIEVNSPSESEEMDLDVNDEDHVSSKKVINSIKKENKYTKKSKKKKAEVGKTNQEKPLNTIKKFVIKNGIKFSITKRKRGIFFYLDSRESENMCKFGKCFIKKKQFEELTELKKILNDEGVTEEEIAKQLDSKATIFHKELVIYLFGQLLNDLVEKNEKIALKKYLDFLQNRLNELIEEKNEDQLQLPASVYKENEMMTLYEDEWILKKNLPKVLKLSKMFKRKIILNRKDGNTNTNLNSKEEIVFKNFKRNLKKKEGKKLKELLTIKSKEEFKLKSSEVKEKDSDMENESETSFSDKDSSDHMEQECSSDEDKSASESEEQESEEEDSVLQNDSSDHLEQECPSDDEDKSTSESEEQESEEEDSEHQDESEIKSTNKKCCNNCGSDEHLRRNCPTLKNSSGSKCFNCNKIGHISRDCPQVHANSQKHKKLEAARQTSRSIGNFFIKKDTKEETAVRNAEISFVFHNVKHGMSYNSLDCLAKNISKFIPDSQISAKMTCGRTKASAITRSVLGPYSQEKLITEIKASYYFSIGSDASNIGNIKTFPYAVQFFDSKKGICQKLLDFYDDADEASLDIFKCLKKITVDAGLSVSQISAYSADNASVNYGIHNSVYQKFKAEYEHIFKANCYCHVINNCVKYAVKGLDVDVENIVIKIFNEFGSSALRTKKLKECFEFSQIEFKELLRHVPTRWLSLLPAIDRLLHNWPAVKYYFLEKGPDNSHRSLWSFISECCDENDITNYDEASKKEGINECNLFFLQNILPEFTKVILLLESNDCTIIDIDHLIRSLFEQLKSRLSDNFFGSKVKSIFRNLNEVQRKKFTSQAQIFMQRAIKYLEERYDFGPDGIYKKLEVLSLKSDEFKLTWQLLSDFPRLLKIEDAVDIDSLYTDFTCLKSVFEILPKDLPNDKIWAYFFKTNTSDECVNLRKIVGFVLSIPTSNAFCERIFSQLNNLWTKERNRMSMELIKSELQTRINYDETCSEIMSLLQSNEGEKLVKMAKSSDKYLKK